MVSPAKRIGVPIWETGNSGGGSAKSVMGVEAIRSVGP